MASVLDEIVATKRTAIAARKAARPLAQVRQQLEQQPPSAPRGLIRSLRRGPTGLILECKHKAPSSGALGSSPYDPVQIARSYQHVASGISVLTDEPYFGGQLSHLTAVRQRVPQPVLCKDFVVDPYQIYEARLHGADAILLMCSVLDPEGLAMGLQTCSQLGMDALVEVRDEVELEYALKAGAELVGINNRCLRTLDVTLETTERLAHRVPEHVTLISESGIQGHGDVRRLRPLVDGFLVGTSMMRHSSPARAARQLAHGRVKICGLTREHDAADAWQLGATWGGLIMVPKSPRSVELERALAIREAAPRLRWAGVFVNESPNTIGHAAQTLRLSAVQLHGDETLRDINALRPQLPNDCQIWKAQPVGQALPPMARRVDSSGPQTTSEHNVDRILLDTQSAGHRGGSGQCFDWQLLQELSTAQRQRIILAGGLCPANASNAGDLGVWALDVNSGVEERPGIKCRSKLEQLFTALRGKGRRHDGPAD